MDTLETLVVRVQGGDLAAYGELIGRFQDMAVGYAYSILGDFHLAQDAAQEAFIQACRDLKQLRAPRAFPAWFRKVVFRQCNRFTRNNRVAMVSLDAVGELPGRKEDPMDNDMSDKVLAAIQALPKPERTVTTLFYINGYTQKDIAGFLNLPEATVNNRLHKARNRLKERMIDMVEKTLKQNAPTEDFSKQILEKMDAFSGTWSEENGILNAMGGGGSGFGAPWNKAITKQSWPGDALCIEFDAVSYSSWWFGPTFQCLMTPCGTPQELLEAKQDFPEFIIHTSCWGYYHWTEITEMRGKYSWSREIMGDPAYSDFNGRVGKWYHVKAERIKDILRLWIDGIPICERKAEKPAPEQVWVMLSSSLSNCRFKNLKVYRPKDDFIREYSKSVKVFAPYRQKRDILKTYPDEVIREASIVFGQENTSKGLIETSPDGTVAEKNIAGKACRKTIPGSHHNQIPFHLRVADPDDWSMHHDIQLEIEYLDQGTGAIVVWYNTWYTHFADTENLTLKNSGQWRTHTFHLRDAAFRPLDKKGDNISIGVLYQPEIALHSVRLREVRKPKEAYEKVIDIYNKEIEEYKDRWPVSHLMYHKGLVLAENLGRGEEGWGLIHRMMEQYPESECVEWHHHQRAALWYRR